MKAEGKQSKLPQRKRWSKQQTDQLKQIYQEQIRFGKKRVWKRIANRINMTHRTSRRQAIQYRWKNYCQEKLDRNNRICKNDFLIENLLRLIPEQGYSQLTEHEIFAGISQSNLKNVFYSTIRSLIKSILKYLKTQSSDRQLHQILAKRNFMKSDCKISEYLITMRRKMNKLKTLLHVRVKSMKVLEDIEQIKADVAKLIANIKQLYHKYLPIKHEDIASQPKQNRVSDMEQVTHDQRYSKDATFEDVQDNQNRELFYQKYSQQKISNFFSFSVDAEDKPFQIQSFPSLEWLINDF